MRSPILLITLSCLLACGDAEKPAPLVAPAEDQIFPLEGDIAGSHILIAYKGAESAAESVSRTRLEAQTRARDLAEELASNPERFEELAKANSDGPTAPRGGRLGSWLIGSMAPEFEAGIATLAVGQISPEPVETAFGFHLIRRDPLAVRHYGADGFFVAYKGAMRAPEGVTRDREAAERLAEEIAAEATPENFEALAHQHNDHGEGPLFLRAFTEDDPVPPEVLATLQNLDFGAVGGPIEFPLGFAVIRRVRLEQRAGAHILIAHREAANTKAVRSREEAREKARTLIGTLGTGERSFEDLAREHSDGPTASHGGLLGNWFRGSMLPAFEEAIDGLDIGAITDQPVETRFGFHIIRRDLPAREPPIPEPSEEER